MPTTTISCPACEAHLSVPAEAAGRKGRCPFCKQQFVVPTDPAAAQACSINDDMITDWLMSPDDEDDGVGGRLGATLREKASEDDAFSSPVRPPESSPTAEADPDTAERSEPDFSDRPHRQRPEQPQADEQAAASTEPDGEATAEPDAEPTAAESATEDAAAGHNEHAEAGAAQPPEDDLDEHGRPKRRYKVQSAIRPIERDEQEQAIEQQAIHDQAIERQQRRLRGEADTACNHSRVNLLDVAADSVLIGFEARLLLRDGFRASVPIRCMECGDTEREGMVARPLAWADRGHGGPVPAGELEARYEFDVHPVDTPRDIVARMPILDELISPFNRPMPYYLCKRCAVNGAVHCSAVDSPRGVLCEVTVPDGRVALEWLGRVNGVCGTEYEQLEREVARFETNAWQQLGEHVRRRITAWFKLRDDEQFITYINDSDFGKKDAGLAGIALTDRRAVFCKYHRHGKLRLNDPDVELLAVRNGPFYDLVAKRQGSPQKLVRLRPDDLEALKEHFADLDAAVAIQQKDS